MGLFSWIADRFRRDSRPEFRGESRREWHERIIWQTETAEILSPLRKLAVTLGENPDERLATHFANVQGMNRDQRYAYVDRVFAETDAQLTQVIREDRGLPSDWDPVLDDATWHYAAGLVKSRNLAAGFPDQAASGAGESGVAADDRQATVDNSPSGRSRDDGWQSLGEEDDWQPVNVGTWRGGSVGAGEVTAPETPAQGSQQPSAGWESRHGPWQSVDGEGYDWDEDQDEGSAREQPQSGVSRASGGADRGTVERTSSVRPATQDRSAWGASATGANRDGDARQQGPQGGYEARLEALNAGYAARQQEQETDYAKRLATHEANYARQQQELEAKYEQLMRQPGADVGQLTRARDSEAYKLTRARDTEAYKLTRARDSEAYKLTREWDSEAYKLTRARDSGGPFPSSTRGSQAAQGNPARTGQAAPSRGERGQAERPAADPASWMSTTGAGIAPVPRAGQTAASGPQPVSPAPSAESANRPAALAPGQAADTLKQTVTKDNVQTGPGAGADKGVVQANRELGHG